MTLTAPLIKTIGALVCLTVFSFSSALFFAEATTAATEAAT
jgi:hypothetical protein